MIAPSLGRASTASNIAGVAHRPKSTARAPAARRPSAAARKSASPVRRGSRPSATSGRLCPVRFFRNSANA